MENQIETKVYPTPADVEGWQYMNEEDDAMGIETRTDEDECVFKRIQLSKGRSAVIRELGPKEMKLAMTMIGKNAQGKANTDNLADAYVALSTIITDSKGDKYPFVMEDLMDARKFKGKDYGKLLAACTSVNF